MAALAIRIALVTLALVVAQMIAGGVTVLALGTKGLPEGDPAALPFQILSNLIVVIVLAWLAQRSRWRGWRLAAALAVVLYGILSFNSIIEAVFFGFFTLETGVTILLMTAFSTVLFAPSLLLLPRREAPLPSRSGWTLRVTAGRFAAGAATYLILYFAFGLMILPFIASFYEGMETPPLLQVVGMALLVRGPIFVGLAVLILALSGAGRTETVLMVAVAMSVLGGVAPLIVPNSLFPDAVRWAHFVEVTTENFLLGWILALLLTKRLVPANGRLAVEAEHAVAVNR